LYYNYDDDDYEYDSSDLEYSWEDETEKELDKLFDSWLIGRSPTQIRQSNV
jgi:hypothetical protein